MGALAEDKLSLASGIGRHDDMFACVEQSFDDFICDTTPLSGL